METNAKHDPSPSTRNPFEAAPTAKKNLTLIGIYIAVVGSIVQSSTLSTLLPVAVADIGGLDYYCLLYTSRCV